MTTIEQIEQLLAQITMRLDQSILSTEAYKAQIAASQEAAEQRAEKADRQMAEIRAAAEKRAEEADKRSKDLDRRIQEVSKQLGGLGNKFGSFTEGLLLPSVEKILRKKFGVTDFYMRLKTKHGEDLQELDGFGFVNGAKNVGFIVEVKSHLDNRSIEQTLKQLRDFGRFHPHFKGMKLHGIIAAVDTVSESQRKAVFNAGLYLVTVNDDVASMPTPPKGFMPFTEIA
ncbi:MAG: DUF3782 domain-containing protein [Candidatus Kapabacteria bacterium]|jgi:hypothetical protein|nr:DUF3782 domain-containing protein [Candidatus Kapabacteria bacterium]